MRGAALTRRVRFTATHRYHRPDWTDAQNAAAFGACASPEPHGHDYICDVTIAGEIDERTGMLVDLGLLDRVLAERVVHRLNGRLINDAFPAFAPGGTMPTCEALARVLAGEVADALAAAACPATVQRVTIAEDDTLSASWTTGD